MRITNLPIWFKQITFQKESRIIANGLTIPYLIGSYAICGQPLDDRPIKSLILEVIESELEVCAVLQKCPYIRQYVIGVDDRKFCDKYIKGQIKFENSLGQSSLFITQNASELGSDLDNIVAHFEELYIDCINNNKFLWNNETKNWELFTEDEINLIEKGK
ncbi:hypothetical protein [uncultured Draconibacterium sp.]|uniref:hypothetical protein n=1 Tax=uncultured Draconibacterium sp. TaxID=1573823 RepID=UPI003216CCBC